MNLDQQVAYLPTIDSVIGVNFAFLRALGYTSEWGADGKVPHMYNLPRENMLAFSIETNEVFIYEVEGDEDETGMRIPQWEPDTGEIKTRQVRRSMPDGWEVIPVLVQDGSTRLIAAPKAI